MNPNVRFPSLLFCLCFLLSILGTGAKAQPTTVTYSDSVPLTQTNWTRSVTLPKFDPSLGTLQSIQITLGGSIQSSMKVESLDTAPHTVMATASGTITLQRPDTSTLTSILPTLSQTKSLASSDGILDFGGTSGFNFGTVIASTSNTITAPPPPSDLTLFTGAGTITLPVVAVATSKFSGSGNLATFIQTQAQANVQVIYTYIPFVNITGTVYVDYNRNGVADTGEPGRAGVTIDLVDAQNNPVGTTTTDSNGFYHFDSLPPGTYTVKETVPTGFVPSPGKPATSLVVTATPGGKTYDKNDFFIVCQPASVGDHVWYDINADGVQDSGEPGLAGLTVRITDTAGNPILNTHGNTIAPMLTDASGNYLFEDVCPGAYIITVENVPSGMVATYDLDGGLDSKAQFTLAANDQKLDVDFGYTGTGKIGDTIWNDANGDAIQQPSEIGIPGVHVTLTWAGPDGDFGTSDDLVFPVQSTDANGMYLFSHLPAGNYEVDVDAATLPTNFVPTYDLDGYASTPNTAATSLGVSNNQVESNLDVDFGYTKTSCLAGYVYVDANNNGLMDSSETPIANVKVMLSGMDNLGNVVTKSTTTDATGAYYFPKLRPGTYTITESQPALYLDGKDTQGTPGTGTTGNDVFTNIVLGSGVHGINNNFGEVLASSLSGFVYVDANNDGVKQGSEAPIANVTVTLSGTDDLGNSVSQSTTTDASGAYSFPNLRPGTYTITETQPAGYQDGKDTQGTPGTGTAGNDVFTAITLGSGVNGADNNFGEQQPSSLSGYVYVDANNDGTKQGTEAGISGVTVTLSGTDDLGNPVSKTTTTGSDGSYSFTNLRPGTYTITETQPSAYLDGKDTIGTPGGNTANDVFSSIVLNSGVNGTNNNFGELQTSSLSGFVYVDANNDGIKQNSETAISGATVTLTGTDDLGNSVNKTTTTGSDGSYSFPNLRPGTYTLSETQPAGYADGKDTIGTPGGTAANDQFSAISLSAGVNGTDNNFGELQGASLSGFVYVDANNDGVKQGSEAGISGVTVTLTGTDDLGNSVNKTTTTGSDGSYSFSNLRPGTYTLTESQPATYNDGKDTIGTPGGNTANDVFSSIVLNSGVNGTNNNFGEITPPVAKTGATRTWGFWKTHLAIMKLALPGINLGVLTCTSAQGGGTQDLTAPTIGQVESIFWTSPGKSTTSVGQSRLQLAHQLIAALANVNYIGTTTAQNGYAATLITDAVAALDGTDTSKMDDLASKLDSFNTSGDALDLPNGLSEGKADSKGAQALAGDPGKAFK